MTTITKERPSLFSADMVRAILAGRKTQTRRVVSWKNSTVLGYPAKSYWPNLHFELAEFRKASLVGAISGMPDDFHLAVPWRHPDDKNIPLDDCGRYAVRPIWEVGDTLWVRETWCPRSGGMLEMDSICKPRYRADGELRPEWGFRWRPSIFMPRSASRITLEVTNVRVQRLCDITPDDVWAEGLPRGIYRHAIKSFHPCDDGDEAMVPDGRVFAPVAAFHILWDSINGKKHPFENNAWVWALTFKATA